MAQKLRDDKIGQLTHSAGNITMAASLSNPAYLTIGGQQYKVTSNLVVALPAMTALTRYQIFAVLNAGVVELRISQNQNSVGPAGFNRWKLIGALYSDGMTSPAFGSFVNITGKPGTNYMPYQPVWSSSGTQPSLGNGSLIGRVRIDGDQQVFDLNFLTGSSSSGGTGQYFFSTPFTMDTAKMSEATPTRTVFTLAYSLYSNQRGVFAVYSSANTFSFFTTTDGGANNSIDYGNAVTATNPTAFANGQQLGVRGMSAPAVGLSNTPIEDL